MTTNIGETDDPYYRYKRPISLVENKSGKTTITNLEDIAKSLHTSPKYILYYIQLAKSTSITTKNELKTILTRSEIEVLINKYIDEYILCSKCKYPELVTKQSDKKLYFSCNACGNHMNIPENKFTKIIYREYKKK
jgi:translation initiation factor 2 beta subunit (eIF-2beta)/eIF-5